MSRIRFTGGNIGGRETPPPSKSYTHRALLLGALSGGRCRIGNPLWSSDTEATADILSSMGAGLEKSEGEVTVDSKGLHAPDRLAYVDNSGTTLRFMTAVCSTFPEETTLDGDPSIRKRPMAPLLEALEAAGAKCQSNEGKAPVKVRGPLTSDRIVIDGSKSSQYVSAVLIASPLLGRPVDVVVTGDRVSRSYVGITVDLMRRFGAEVEETGDGYRVSGRYSPADVTVPADYSSAAFPLVAGALGGSVEVRGTDPGEGQGDRRIVEVLERSGAKVVRRGTSIEVSRDGRHSGIDVDMGDMPDLFPVVAAYLSTAEGTSRLYGAPQLRYKESDRIESTVAMLRNLGADVEGTDDGCVIRGVERLRGGSVETLGDHRIFMAAAIASISADGPVSMEDDGCWNVSYPGFPERMARIGLRHEEL